MMGLVMAVTVIGLKIVGLILIVALLIIPPVTARFWTERIGTRSGSPAASARRYRAMSARRSPPPRPPADRADHRARGSGDLPVLAVLRTGARCRRRGLAALAVPARVHMRQGLLALARSEPIHDALTLLLLRQAGLIRADGVATDAGRAQAAKAARDELRWEVGAAGAPGHGADRAL
jgi:manganese/zinc/iron transport system permease protein